MASARKITMQNRLRLHRSIPAKIIAMSLGWLLCLSIAWISAGVFPAIYQHLRYGSRWRVQQHTVKVPWLWRNIDPDFFSSNGELFLSRERQGRSPISGMTITALPTSPQNLSGALWQQKIFAAYTQNAGNLHPRERSFSSGKLYFHCLEMDGTQAQSITALCRDSSGAWQFTYDGANEYFSEALAILGSMQ